MKLSIQNKAKQFRFFLQFFLMGSLLSLGIFSCFSGAGTGGGASSAGPGPLTGVTEGQGNGAAPQTPPSTVSLDPGGECRFCAPKCEDGKENDQSCKDCLDLCKRLGQYGVDCNADCVEGNEESSACKTCVAAKEALAKASEPIQPAAPAVDPATMQGFGTVQQAADPEAENKPPVNIQVKKPYEEPAQIPNINFGH